MEVWREIQGIEGYSISDEGRVRNDKTKRIKINAKNKVGYMVVTLKGKTQAVHRLVANAFIPNPENKPTVNHKDGNKTNNCLWNLEWATYAENNLHAYRVLDSEERRKRIGEKSHWKQGHIVTEQERKKMSEAKKKTVICIETGKIYSCAEEASKDATVGKQCIIHCCNGRVKTAGGMHYKYTLEEG